MNLYGVWIYIVMFFDFVRLLNSHVAEPEIANTTNDVQQSIMFAMGSIIEPTMETPPSMEDRTIEINASVVTDCMF